MGWMDHPHREALEDLVNALRYTDEAWEQYCAPECNGDECNHNHRVPPPDLEAHLASARHALRDCIIEVTTALSMTMSAGPGVRKET